jgi:hypothetical protein
LGWWSGVSVNNRRQLHLRNAAPSQIIGLTVNPSKTSATITWDPTSGATGYTVWIDLVSVLHHTLYRLTDIGQTYLTKKTTFFDERVRI